jgi:hypothetical protein
MRALGYYPTEQQVEDLLNEVTFAKFVQTGQHTHEINFEELIKCKSNLSNLKFCSEFARFVWEKCM